MKTLPQRSVFLRGPARESREVTGGGGRIRSRFSRSGLLGIFLLVSTLTLAPLARAQWQNATFSLTGGWNAIYLHGHATYATPDVLFADHPEILEVWRWNPNPNPATANGSSLTPSASSPEWSRWIRGQPGQTTLSQIDGQTAYLVKCDGASTADYKLTINQKIVPPKSTWVRNGANFLGFPTRLGTEYPYFSNYFATFPTAIATNSGIYKYVGGDIGPGNPKQVFSPSTERLDRNQAYWFEAAVVGEFYGPLEISPANPDGLDYGRTGNLIVVRVRNRTSAVVTLTIAPVDSEEAPHGQTAVAGRVPLRRRVLNAQTGNYAETALTAAYTETLDPLAAKELQFVVDRPSMTGADDALFASLLRFTDSGSLMDVYLPVRAQVHSLAGLWIGDVAVTGVNSQAPAQRFTAEITRTTGTVVVLTGGAGSGATATATVSGGEVTALTVTSEGSGYTVAPAVNFTGGAGTGATATATVSGGAVTGFTVTKGGTGYVTPPTVALAIGTGAKATATVSLGGVITGLTVTSGGANYTTVPTVAFIGSGGTGATATATLSGGVVTALTVTNGGTGYVAPVVTKESAALAVGGGANNLVPLRLPFGTGGVLTYQWKKDGTVIADATHATLALNDGEVVESGVRGSTTKRSYPLRILLHIDQARTARLLSQVFMGKLAATPTTMGLCTKEVGLLASDLASAHRYSAAHMPLVDPISTKDSASVVVNNSDVTWIVTVPHDHKTNPFVHAYHPDHDNKKADFLSFHDEGVESYKIVRSCTFTFLKNAPEGTSTVGWGSTVIGGMYSETVTGLHKNPLTVTGTFQLRRVSEIASLTIN